MMQVILAFHSFIMNEPNYRMNFDEIFY